MPMNGDREPGFQHSKLDAVLVEFQAVLARHGFGGMAIEAIEFYPVAGADLSAGVGGVQGYVAAPGLPAGVAGVQGYVPSALPRMPDIASYPIDSGAGAFIKAGPVRRCPDGKPAVFRCFATPDGKLQCRWVCP
jgi:hypothetical protein